MIARLRGTLVEKAPGQVIVDVGGVGYQALISVSTFCRLPDTGEPVDLVIITNLRDNALELFGFADSAERDLFRLLRGVAGIGPRLALSILSGIEAAELVEVLDRGDADRLRAVPGVGRKTAERLVVELGGRMQAAAPGASEVAITDVESDAVHALVSLGYRQSDARKAVTATSEGSSQSIEALIKRSLAHLRP